MLLMEKVALGRSCPVTGVAPKSIIPAKFMPRPAACSFSRFISSSPNAEE